MLLALVNGRRSTPAPRLRGLCPVCGTATVAKCGSRKSWHWAHLRPVKCDPWWENETDWHRAWKAHFPEDWQEVLHVDQASGERHIADVKTALGLVIEFQHSQMSLEELRAREAFYGHMIWIVDGTPFASNFEVDRDPLPHPESRLLDEIVFPSGLA
jgi:competence protein CoiA